MSLLKKLAGDLTAKIKTDAPNPYRLADDQDTIGWETPTDGRMANAGTEDDEVTTVPYDGDA